MQVIVILAAFLTAASATPVQDVYSKNNESYSGGDSPVPPTDVSSDKPAVDDTISPGSELPPPPPEEEVTPPPDQDPFDCNVTDSDEHIFLNCSFICGGDEAVQVLNGKPCSLNHTELHAEDYNSTGPSENAIGVCDNGQCVPKRTDPTVPGSESSTAGTTTTSDVTANTATDVKESSPQSSPAEATTTPDQITSTSSATEFTATTGVTENTQQSTTSKATITTETSSPEGPVRTEHPVVEKGIMSQTPQSPPESGPVAMP